MKFSISDISRLCKQIYIHVNLPKTLTASSASFKIYAALDHFEILEGTFVKSFLVRIQK